MANNTLKTYETLRAGHAKALGIDINNMTDEQARQLEHRLTEHGVNPPESAIALPGTAQPNPSPENEGSIATTTKGRAKKTKAPAPVATQSPGDFNPEVMRVFEHLAQQGDAAGFMGMQIFQGAYTRRVKEGMVDFVTNGTKPIQALNGTADDFLDSLGY